METPIVFLVTIVTVMEKETRSLSLVSIGLSRSLQSPPSSKSLIAWLRRSWRSIVPKWSLQSPQFLWLNASSQMMAVLFSLQLSLIVSLPTLESIRSLFKIACYLSVLLPFEVSFTPYPVIISLYFDLASCGNIANFLLSYVYLFSPYYINIMQFYFCTSWIKICVGTTGENRISIICFYAFNYKISGNRDDQVEIMDHQDRRNHPIKFLDDGGNCDDCDDHMKARLSTLLEKINPCTTNKTKTKFHALLGCGNWFGWPPQDYLNLIKNNYCRQEPVHPV